MPAPGCNHRDVINGGKCAMLAAAAITGVVIYFGTWLGLGLTKSAGRAMPSPLDGRE